MNIRCCYVKYSVITSSYWLSDEDRGSWQGTEVLQLFGFSCIFLFFCYHMLKPELWLWHSHCDRELMCVFNVVLEFNEEDFYKGIFFKGFRVKKVSLKNFEFVTEIAQLYTSISWNEETTQNTLNSTFAYYTSILYQPETHAFYTHVFLNGLIIHVYLIVANCKNKIQR